MTEREWLSIGLEKGIIDAQEYEEISFLEAYREWFVMKMNCVKKKQSIDRIEVTFNKYFANAKVLEMPISSISDGDIIKILHWIIYSYPHMTLKEFAKVMQVMKSPLVYMRDIGRGGVPLHDWEMIKRNIPMEKLEVKRDKENAIPMQVVEHILDCVLNGHIYPVKYNTSLLLCMNFYLGLRVGELASLTFDDFDLERNVVKIYKTESKYYERSEDGSKLGVMVYRVVDSTKTVYSVREIPLVPEVKLILQMIRDRHSECGYDTPYLCYDGQDTIKVKSLDRTLRKLCKLCDVRYFNTHLIRKTFATMLHDNGVPTRAISDLLGHSDIATTENSYILSYADKYEQYLGYMRGALKFTL